MSLCTAAQSSIKGVQQTIYTIYNLTNKKYTFLINYKKDYGGGGINWLCRRPSNVVGGTLWMPQQRLKSVLIVSINDMISWTHKGHMCRYSGLLNLTWDTRMSRPRRMVSYEVPVCDTIKSCTSWNHNFSLITFVEISWRYTTTSCPTNAVWSRYRTNCLYNQVFRRNRYFRTILSDSQWDNMNNMNGGRFQAPVCAVMFLPFIWSPQDFSKHLQLAELPSQLAKPALLVKLRGTEMGTKVSMQNHWKIIQIPFFQPEKQCWDYE